jgi:hypothetical protein
MICKCGAWSVTGKPFVSGHSENECIAVLMTPQEKIEDLKFRLRTARELLSEVNYDLIGTRGSGDEWLLRRDEWLVNNP